jgi:hypothetical protein
LNPDIFEDLAIQEVSVGHRVERHAARHAQSLLACLVPAPRGHLEQPILEDGLTAGRDVPVRRGLELPLVSASGTKHLLEAPGVAIGVADVKGEP